MAGGWCVAQCLVGVRVYLWRLASHWRLLTACFGCLSSCALASAASPLIDAEVRAHGTTIVLTALPEQSCVLFKSSVGTRKFKEKYNYEGVRAAVPPLRHRGRVVWWSHRAIGTSCAPCCPRTVQLCY